MTIAELVRRFRGYLGPTYDRFSDRQLLQALVTAQAIRFLQRRQLPPMGFGTDRDGRPTCTRIGFDE